VPAPTGAKGMIHSGVAVFNLIIGKSEGAPAREKKGQGRTAASV